MHKRRHPTWPMIGVAVAIIILVVVASGPRYEGGGLAISAAIPVSRSLVEPETGALAAAGSTATEPPWLLVRADRELPQTRTDYVTPLRTAPPMPPVADRVFRDTVLVETPPGPAVAAPSRTEPPLGENLTRPDESKHLADTPPNALERSAIENGPDIMACWPLPRVVIDALDEFIPRQVGTDWAQRVEASLRQLHEVTSLADPQAARILDQLDLLVTEASTIAAKQATVAERTQLMRIAFALERRLAVWRSVHQLASPKTSPVATSENRFDAAAMTRHVLAVEGQIARLDNAETWRKYLLLDEVRQMESQQWTASAEQRSRAAREILNRLAAANVTAEQEQFFTAPAWQDFTNELRKWVVEPVDYETLLDNLEGLEETGLDGSARAVAESYQWMRWSASPPIVELADHLNTYYRNANIRVAISAELVNRLLPHPATTDEKVDDMLMGGRVFGRSRVSTRLRLVLFPDREQWKMELEAEGQVDSRTETKHGPAIFHNAGRAQYLARKLLLLDGRGLRTEEAEAAASSDADLTKLETDLDGVPLVNLLVRSIARQQYDSKSDAANWEAEGLLANRAQARLDDEVDKQLRQSTEKFRAQILEPLQDLGLRPETVDMETTQERLIARYRLAGYHQVGAFTPRPQAVAGSLLSLQIHETALNNVMASLQLAGQETDLPSLFREIARQFRRDNYEVPEDLPTDVTIRLADQDPIRFSCSDDRIHLTLRIAKLDAGEPNVWRDFEVRTSYLPELEGLHVRLVRDDIIRLKGRQGRRLAMRDQVALRGIFCKVLSQHPDVDLLGNILIRDRRLHDLHVTQLVLRDGWIGLSIGLLNATGDPNKPRVADAADARKRG
ncbi:MAG: hypothetical protein ACYC3X_00460 [Pirellulaceae bacterium]